MSDSSISDTKRRLDEIADGRLLLGQSETRRALGVSRDRLIEEIESGRLRYVLVGSRRKFTPGDIADYIQRQEQQCQPEGDQRGPGANWNTGNSSPGDQTSRSGGKTSPSPVVVDFAEALALTARPRPRSPSSPAAPTRSRKPSPKARRQPRKPKKPPAPRAASPT